MNQTKSVYEQPASRKIPAVLLSIALWVISLGTTGLCIFAVRALFLWGLGLLITGSDTGQRLQAANVIDFAHQCFIVVIGMAALVVMLFSTDYVFRHTGQPRLIRRLLMIIGVEALIILPVALMLWR